MSNQAKAPHALCSICPLLKAQGPVLGHGPSNPKLVIVGEAPGGQEVRSGVPFIGPSGQLLDAALSAVGVEPSATYRTNVVLCRPPSNRPPSDQEIACCRPRLLVELRERPGAVVTMGATAAKALGSTKGILAIRGAWANAPGLDGRAYLPTLHPAFVLRQPAALVDMINDLEKALVERATPVPPFKPTIIDTVWQMELAPGAQLVYDVETDAQGDLLSINLAWGPNISDTCVLVGDAIKALQKLDRLHRSGVQYIAHNGKFDVEALHRAGIEARLDFDTMLAHYALDERKGGSNVEGQFQRGVHGLKVLASQYFDSGNYDAEADQLAKARPRGKAGEGMPSYDMARVPLNLLATYGTLDAHYTWRLKQLFEVRLREVGIYDNLFQALLMPASEAFTIVEIRGMYIDRPALNALKARWELEIEDIHDDLCVLGGEYFNPRAPAQVARILYDKLKLPTPPKRAQVGSSFKGGGERSTDKTALTLIQTLHPIVKKMLLYRRVQKLLSAYVEAIYSHLSADSRIRTNNKVHGTEVGRIQSEDPSLHNLPRADDKEEGQYGKAIRDLFAATPGYLFGAGDLSQAELRVAAFLSRDLVLMQAFKDGGDPHSNVAKRVFGEGSGEEERYVAKAINFGVLYGGKKKTLVARVMDLRGFRPSMVANPREVDDIVQNYMDTMTRLFEWREEQFQRARKDGYVETLMGRRRRFMFINDENEDEVRKACVHAQVAGLASDINTLAFARLTKEGYRTLLTVHDSILFEAPIADIKPVSQYVVQCMMDEWNKWITDVPGAADVKVGERWGSLAKLK